VKQWEAVDETGQVWVILEGDRLSYIWTENPHLPDRVMAPRRLFINDEGERPAPVAVRREDALNDDLIHRSVEHTIWQFLDRQYT
jgi:hypothetical protein